MGKASISRPEQDLQISVCRYLDIALPKSWRYWATYNNAKNRTQGGINKAMGVKAGFPDLCAAGPIKGKFLLVGMELKTGRQKPSEAQADWIDWFLSMDGSDAYVCRSLIDVEAALRMAGVPVRASVGGDT